MEKATLNIGQELHGDSIVYRIEAVLGQGSFGVTYKAKAFMVMKGKFGEELVEISTPKAIKEFFMKEVNGRDESGSVIGMSEGGLSYNYAQKFRKEAENLASMNHPNIVKVIDFITANNTYYYVMDYIEGENLNDYLKHHKMSETEATATIVEVASALQYMHEAKHMLHLDIKPGNIMRRNNDGHIFLIDFGLSKHYSDEGIPETSTSVGLGTQGYAPIEQANSKNAKQFRATLDVYALGATFYKLLTGQTPPPADELVSDDELITKELSDLNISGVLVAAVTRSMMPSVKHRTKDIKGFLADLNFRRQDDVLFDDSFCDDEVTIVADEVIMPNAESTLTGMIEETPFLNNHNEHVKLGNANSFVRNLIKYYIPGAWIVCCIIVLIKLHSEYYYAEWWVDEEYVIGGAVSLFLVILLVYYLIVRYMSHGRK